MATIIGPSPVFVPSPLRGITDTIKKHKQQQRMAEQARAAQESWNQISQAMGYLEPGMQFPMTDKPEDIFKYLGEQYNAQEEARRADEAHNEKVLYLQELGLLPESESGYVPDTATVESLVDYAEATSLADQSAAHAAATREDTQAHDLEATRLREDSETHRTTLREEGQDRRQTEDLEADAEQAELNRQSREAIAWSQNKTARDNAILSSKDRRAALEQAEDLHRRGLISDADMASAREEAENERLERRIDAQKWNTMYEAAHREKMAAAVGADDLSDKQESIRALARTRGLDYDNPTDHAIATVLYDDKDVFWEEITKQFGTLAGLERLLKDDSAFARNMTMAVAQDYFIEQVRQGRFLSPADAIGYATHVVETGELIPTPDKGVAPDEEWGYMYLSESMGWTYPRIKAYQQFLASRDDAGQSALMQPTGAPRDGIGTEEQPVAALGGGQQPLFHRAWNATQDFLGLGG